LKSTVSVKVRQKSPILLTRSRGYLAFKEKEADVAVPKYLLVRVYNQEKTNDIRGNNDRRYFPISISKYYSFARDSVRIRKEL
jgi:hypothetical protein